MYIKTYVRLTTSRSSYVHEGWNLYQPARITEVSPRMNHSSCSSLQCE